MTDELAAVRAALDERKLVERAKGLLMAHHGLDEEAAYRLLRQNAMNQKRRLSDVARALGGQPVVLSFALMPYQLRAGECSQSRATVDELPPKA